MDRGTVIVASHLREHIGNVRLKNEDSVYINEAAGVFAVCDGMGGEAYGALAAQLAADTVAQFSAALHDTGDDAVAAVADRCIQTANRKICDRRRSRSACIGTTIALVRTKGSRLDAFNVGDSRIYLFRGGTLQQISADHTVLQSREKMGIPTPDAARKRYGNQLTQHLGIFEETMMIQPHHAAVDLRDKDVILLCSDGLTDMVCDSEICRTLAAEADAGAAADSLLRAALHHGGTDNISLILLQAARPEPPQ